MIAINVYSNENWVRVWYFKYSVKYEKCYYYSAYESITFEQEK